MCLEQRTGNKVQENVLEVLAECERLLPIRCIHFVRGAGIIPQPSNPFLLLKWL